MSRFPTGLRRVRESARRVAWVWWAIVYFVLLTLAVTWPLVLRMGNSVAGRHGDSLVFIWLIGWVQKALFVLHQSPLFTQLINHPEGWRLASTEMAPAMILTGLPFSLFWGPVLGYNLSVLLSFAGSGLVVCWWVYRLTGRLIPSLAAGSIFAFSSFRVAHFIAGHLNLLGTQWIALYFMSLYEVLESSGRSRAWMVLGGVSLGLVALTSQYYLYMTAVLSVLFVLVHALVRGPSFVLQRAYLARLLGVLAVAAPLVFLAEYPYIEAMQAGKLPTRSVDAAVRNSAGVADYLLPATWNTIAGDFVAEHFDRSMWIESSLYLGVGASAMALIALVVPEDKPGRRATKYHLAILAGAALALSLGPVFQCFSGEAPPRLPPALAGIAEACEVTLPLPGELLYRFLPFYTSVRVPARYGVYVILFLSVLAGLGIAYLAARGRGVGRSAVILLVLAVVAIDLEPWQVETALVAPRELDYWLAAQPGEGAVVEFPPDRQANWFLAYYGLTHGKPILGGQNVTRFPGQDELLTSDEGIPSKETLDRLRAIRVQFIIVDTGWYEDIDALDDLDEALVGLGIDEAARFEGYRVYLLEP